MGSRVREARKQRGLTQAALGRAVRVSQGRIAQVEGGTKPPNYGLATLLQDALDLGQQLTELLPFVDHKTFAEWAAMFLAKQMEADRIQEFSHLIPGLLQTRAYATSLVEAAQIYDGTVDEDRVSVRIARQSAIFDRAAPPWVQVIVSESALRACIGSAEVMREQLAHLLQMGQRERVSVAVLPFAKADGAALTGSLSVLQMPSGHSVAYTEGMQSGTLLESKDDVSRYQALYDRLRSRALDEADSASLISQVMKEYSE
ncbi:helix-turn-helix transcriptional regulator [Streptomyces sp. NPDC001941]|uniref:helix-turn-helix domain-containing protein n=1 Tax=Streptomyces sp. NPDC001941 TaxID=3154659 RepID=UPI00332C6AD8